MAVFKCKMCGAVINAENIDSLVQCEHCKTQQNNPEYPLPPKTVAKISGNAADLYTHAMNLKREAGKKKDARKAEAAQEIFNSISGYLDAAFQADECGQLAEELSV